MTIRAQGATVALRLVVRFAWWLNAVAKRLERLGEQIEQWADKKAAEENVDPCEVLWPLVSPMVAQG